MRIPRRFLFGLALVAIAGPFLLPVATAQLDLTGEARVVDGDSIVLNGERVRLFGIDAPEHDQTCHFANGAKWACGVAATLHLVLLTSGKTLRCHERDTDRYGRIVAVCFAADVDINAEMVRAGLAVSYRRYSNRYDGDEVAARLARRGIWDGEFVSPELWRRGLR